MLNKIKNIFGFSSNSYSDSLKGMVLYGELHLKEIGRNPSLLAEECALSLSIKNEKEFDYALNVVNGDDQGKITSKIKLNKLLDNWQSKSFHLTNDLAFKFCTEDGKENLIWEQDKKFYIFRILIDEGNSKVKENFLSALTELITSFEYEIDLSQAAKETGKGDYLTQLGEVENINQFLEQNYAKLYGDYSNSNSNKIEINNTINLNSNIDNYDNFLSKEMDNKLKITQLYFKKAYPNAVPLFEAKGVLYRYDKNDDDLKIVTKSGLLQVYKVESFKYYLVVDENGQETTHTCTSISQEINLITNRLENLIMWLSREEITNNSLTAYNFVFYEEDKVDSLKRLLAKTQYETSTLSRYEDLNEDDKHWLESENMPDEELIDDNIKDIEMEIANEFQESVSDRPNKVTAQAYLHDRTFVVRDNNTIGVYKTDEDDVLSHLANLPAVAEYDDKNIDIKNAQMFYSDTNMILLDKNNPNSAFRYDLGKGKIIEEWTAENMKSIDALAQEKKFDQMTDNQLVVGVNTNNLFTMDARVNKKNKVVNTKAYKTNPKMNCLVTTDFGGIATGSLNGEIRLYNQVGKNAKTLLPCFGDPIRSVDVTADGRYLLATCDKYLILIPTICKGDKNGFSVQMGKEKPHPKTLKIKPIDLNKYGLEKFHFTHARFNVNQHDGETNIITSMGDYIVIWNFAKIKKGILDDYKIKKVNQNVLDNQFKFNRGQIVVTMENKLRIQNQKQLFGDK